MAGDLFHLHLTGQYCPLLLDEAHEPEPLDDTDDTAVREQLEVWLSCAALALVCSLRVVWHACMHACAFQQESEEYNGPGGLLSAGSRHVRVKAAHAMHAWLSCKASLTSAGPLHEPALVPALLSAKLEPPSGYVGCAWCFSGIG